MFIEEKNKILDISKLYKDFNSDNNFLKGKTEAFLKDLDDEQKMAVLDSEGRSLIIAGPGAGKTTVIVYKLAYLLLRGVSPSSIMLVTFTKKAAREMLARAQRLVKVSLNNMYAGTFHHVANMWLKRYGGHIDIPRDYSIVDRGDSKQLMKISIDEVLEQEKIDKKNKRLIYPSEKVILDIYSLSVNTLCSIDEVLRNSYPTLVDYTDLIEKAIKRYKIKKKVMKLLDFDDLLHYAYILLRDVKEVRKRLISQLKWILVDEFQDTNLLQYEILELLYDGNNNLIVVGDDSQSIYAFRGARYENVLDFSSKKDCKIFKIQTNYRSTPQIVAFSNHFIPNNVFNKKIKAVRKDGPKPVIVRTLDKYEEAAFVLYSINRLIEAGYDYSDIAVLYRSHAHSIEVQMELTRQGMPFKVFSGARFTESAHIKDVLAFLKLLLNPKDELSWSRVIKLFYGLGSASLRSIISAINDKGVVSFSEVIDVVEKEILPKVDSARKEAFSSLLIVLKEIKRLNKPSEIIQRIYDLFYKEYLEFTYDDYKERSLDVRRIMEFSLRYKDVESFLSDILLADEVSVEEGGDIDNTSFVTLTTVHQAKGLEWKVVFVLAVNPGDFPSWYMKTDEDLNEEARIFYVAITRAKDILVLLRQPAGSNPWKANRFVLKSGKIDFLSDIPEDLVEYVSVK